MHRYVHCSTIYKSPDLKTAQVFISGHVLHLHHGLLVVGKMKELLPFVTAQRDLEIIMLREISQSDKDKYYMISLLCGI